MASAGVKTFLISLTQIVSYGLPSPSVKSACILFPHMTIDFILYILTWLTFLCLGLPIWCKKLIKTPGPHYGTCMWNKCLRHNLRNSGNLEPLNEKQTAAFKKNLRALLCMYVWLLCVCWETALAIYTTFWAATVQESDVNNWK